MNSVIDEIKNTVENNQVVLYMKGTPDFPQCGFSAKVANILKQCDIEFKSINVLADDEVRQGIKEYANWPTIPQLYIRGQFIGGCDIVSEMFAKGELQEMLSQ